MKYRQGKTKKEHHIPPGGEKYIRLLEQDPTIKCIIPGIIKQTGKRNRNLQEGLNIQYSTRTGEKFLLKCDGAIMELFVVRYDDYLKEGRRTQ